MVVEDMVAEVDYYLVEMEYLGYYRLGHKQISK